MTYFDRDLVGIGLYTPAEAARLVSIPARKIVRWLRGHDVKGVHYERLWEPQIDLGDGHVYLGFRDLMEARVANAFLKHGLSAIKVRRAIRMVRELTGHDHPLSSARFRTDGRSVFLQIGDEDNEDQLIDILKSQYAFLHVLEPSLCNVEFDRGVPARWWPNGVEGGIVVDPHRAFGRPIDAESSVPTEALAAAAEAEGSPEAAAKQWSVSPDAIRRAIAFQHALGHAKVA